jgi:hypothetical protein
VFKKINFKSISEDEYNNIKDILKHMGKDIKKIIEAALNHLGKANISNLLIGIFDDYYFKELKKISKKYNKNIIKK